MDWDQEERVLEALHRIAELLRAQEELLERICKRLPQPATFHPVSRTAGSITVRS
jgi:hypothetical protein